MANYHGVFIITYISLSNTIDDFTFVDGVITIGDENAVIILARPAGKNCKWQAFAVIGSGSPKTQSLTESDVVGGVVTRVNNYVYSPRGAGDIIDPVVIPSSVTFKTFKDAISHTARRPVTAISKLLFTVKSGTAASFNFTKSKSDLAVPPTKGNTTISENRVEVSANATSTDSINSDYLQVIVED